MARTELRPVVSQEHLDYALDQLRENLTRRIEQHGAGAFASKHEVLGIITEE